MEFYKINNLLINQNVTKEEWLKNKESYDFLLVDREIAIKANINTALVLAIIEWKDTLNRKTIAEFSALSTQTIGRCIAWLTSNGYLKKKKHLIQEQIKADTLNAKKEKICEWCKGRAYMLHEHHYPVPKRDGGTETVNICPNCHSTFHYIESIKVEHNAT